MWKYIVFCPSFVVSSRLNQVVGGIVMPSHQDDNKLKVIPNTISRKRVAKAENLLPLETVDEYGSELLAEDTIFWNRILDETSFPEPDRDDCNFGVDAETRCSLADEPSTSCLEYMKLIGSDPSKKCIVPIRYNFAVMNQGTQDDLITKISSAVNGQLPFDHTEDQSSTPVLSLTPGSHLNVSRTISFNFCETHEEGIKFKVTVECGRGDPNIFHRTLSFDSIRPTSTCDSKLALSIVHQVPYAKCNFRPHYFDLLFSGRQCDEGKNSQYSCKDIHDVSEHTQVFIVIRGKRNRIYFADYVNKLDVFKVGFDHKKDSVLSIHIYDAIRGARLQVTSFSSSCSKNLALNDVYGAISIVGFGDNKTNIALQDIGPPQLNIAYKLTNTERNVIGIENITVSAIESDYLYEQSFNSPDTVKKIAPYRSISNSSAFTSAELRLCDEVTASVYYYVLPDLGSRLCNVQVSEFLFHSPMMTEAKKGKEKQTKKGKGKRKSPKSTSVRCKRAKDGKVKKVGKKKMQKKQKKKDKNNDNNNR